MSIAVQTVPAHRALSMLCLLLCLIVPVARASYWTVTSRRVVQPSTTTLISGDTIVLRETFGIRSNTTPTATPFASTTRTSVSSELDIVYLYYLEGAVPPEAVLTEPSATSPSASLRTSVSYVLPTVYKPPATCPNGGLDISTLVTTTIPTEVTHLYTPASTNASTWSTYVYSTRYLSQDQVTLPKPSGIIRWLNSCPTPTVSIAPAPPCGDMSCASFRKTIIIVVCVLGGMFLLGFLESYFWFQRLMKGQSTFRFGTFCWALTTFICLVCISTESARSREDQVALKEQWKAVPLSRRLNLWLRWGFTSKYPTELLGERPAPLVGLRGARAETPKPADEQDSLPPPSYNEALVAEPYVPGPDPAARPDRRA